MGRCTNESPGKVDRLHEGQTFLSPGHPFLSHHSNPSHHIPWRAWWVSGTNESNESERLHAYKPLLYTVLEAIARAVLRFDGVMPPTLRQGGERKGGETSEMSVNEAVELLLLDPPHHWSLLITRCQTLLFEKLQWRPFQEPHAHRKCVNESIWRGKENFR